MLNHRLTVAAALAVVTTAASARLIFSGSLRTRHPKKNAFTSISARRRSRMIPRSLSRLRGLKVEQISGGGKSQELQIKHADESLVAAPVGKESPQAYGLTYTYGVHSRNGETYLLVYHAQMYPDSTHNRWNSPASDQRLPLELVPSLVQGKLTVAHLVARSACRRRRSEGSSGRRWRD